MDRKHVSKVGKCMGWACLLFVCATLQSCRDEYFFDDTEPTWLGASIYDELDERGEFTYFLRVIDDLDYKEVLQKTGSKTLFVADDKAFMDGVKKKWKNVSSYEDLTTAQKRVILNSAMLDNAYLLEMLSKQPSTATNSEPTPGLSLRRTTSAVVTDTIPLFHWDDLPENNTAWDVFRSEKRKVRLALDATSTMLTHFTEAQSYMNNITQKDLQLILGDPTAQLTDCYIFDKKVIESDITCKNGYVHQLDGLLIPPANMAEEIRQNGEDVDVASLANSNSTTYLFSRVLDRFSVPVVNSSVSEEFNRLYHSGNGNGAEVVYEKRYYTEGSNRGSGGAGFLSYTDVNGKKYSAEGSLLFDPGWNAYKAGTSGTTNEQDMGAIFAPSDSALYSYFTDGGGKALVNQYGKNADGLVAKIDSIPLDVMQALVRNHMQMSFNSTVPSKFNNILNDARDPMRIMESDVVKCMVANNGVVYVMDTVYSPVRYVAVTAPVMLSDTMTIFNRAIEDLDYDKYLLSTGNKFGLIVASDNAMVYYDPKTQNNIGEGASGPIAYKFVQVMKNGTPVTEVEKWSYKYSEDSYGPLVKKEGTDGGLSTLLKEILEYNIIVDDLTMQRTDLAGNRKYPKYYMSKGYGTVKVERNATGEITSVAGGRELQHGKTIPVGICHEQDNGLTLQLDEGLIHPATQSVYKVLGQRSEYEKFYSLCSTKPSDDLLKYIGISSAKEREKYGIFITGGLDNSDRLVRMFDTYHYTVYVPSNEAMTKAHEEQGLPTWEELEAEKKKLESWASDSLVKLKKAFVASKLEADSMKWIGLKEQITQDSLALKANVELLHHFIKYHFQDNSVFVDDVRHAIKLDIGDVNGDGARDYEYDDEVTYETSALDAESNKFCSVLVKTAKSKDGKETISVRGDFPDKQESDPDYNTCYVVNTNPGDENALFNVMTRDIDFNGGSYVYTSSYAVVHLIDGVLANEIIFDAETNKFKTNK